MNELEIKLLEKIDLLAKLTTLNIIKDKEFKDQVRILSSIGLKPKEIAGLLGKTPNNVRVTLSMIRKERSKNKAEP